MTKINKEEAKEKLLQFLKSMTREMLFTCAGGKISAFPKTNWQGMKKCKTPHWLPVAFTKKEWNG